MAYFKNTFDIQLDVYRTYSKDSKVAFKSQYTEIQFPSTSKKIEGFLFDKTRWKSEAEQNTLKGIPTFWDPRTTNIKDLLKSGIGDDKDLLVHSVEENNYGSEESQVLWSPKLEHGHYYNARSSLSEYLYSDDSITMYPEQDTVWVSNLNSTISGGNILDLEFQPKPGIPISARSLYWNKEEGVYKTSISAKKKVEFTATTSGVLTQQGDELYPENFNTAEPEFIILNNQVVFNKQVSVPVGKELLTMSGFNSAEIESLELVGLPFEQDFQEHHLLFAPIDRTAPIQIILEDGTQAIEQTIVEEFTEGNENEVIVDYDLGILRFGSLTKGGRPSILYNIRAYYYKTFAFEYEPDNSRDTIISDSTNLSPLSRYNSDGFVLLKSSQQEPAVINLTAELASISEDYYGPLYIGNSFSKLKAEVLDKYGLSIEAQEIFFELLTPTIGAFGTEITGSAISNTNGIASLFYNPPKTIENLGGAVSGVNTVSGVSELYLESYFPPAGESSLFLFQVHSEDSILGIPKSQLRDFYEDYIDSENIDITSSVGPRINVNLGSLGSYGWITGAYTDFIKWEILHRSYFDLPTPITYDPENLRTGKKTVISVFDTEAVNPHTGTTPAFVPLQPDSYVVTESGTYVYFDYSLPSTGSVIKSYLVVGPTVAQMRAYAVNPVTKQIIYSNTISVLIDIPDTANGLLKIDAINSVPSGLLGNAHNWDQENIPLEYVELTSSGLLPLGWRIRSTGITLASALDGITFLDINPLTTPDDTMSHTFEIE